jgi:hypothetical protein
MLRYAQHDRINRLLRQTLTGFPKIALNVVSYYYSGIQQLLDIEFPHFKKCLDNPI